MPQAAIRQYEEEEVMPEGETSLKAPENMQEETRAEQKPVKLTRKEKRERKKNKNQKEGEYYRYTIDKSDPDPWLVKHRFKLIAFVVLLVGAIAGNYFYEKHVLDTQTRAYIADPVIGDLYYLDFRLIQDNLRPSEKYRMAKVTDLTGDVVTIKYSSYFYLQEHELGEAIRYGQLRFGRFFQERRHDFKIAELKAMIDSGAITLARRPDGNMLDGNVVIPDKQFESKNKLFIPGKKENAAGEELLKLDGVMNDEQAYKQFSNAAAQGYAPGQVNLAQLYLTGKGVSKDEIEALAILKQAALQAYEPAVLKYTIVCKQVESCTVEDFYQDLVNSGVNIKFSKTATATK